MDDSQSPSPADRRHSGSTHDSPAEGTDGHEAFGEAMKAGYHEIREMLDRRRKNRPVGG